jgi:hypothetical protein
MREIRERHDAKERATARRRNSPEGFGTAVWRDATAAGQDGVTVIALVTDTIDGFVEVEVQASRVEQLDEQTLARIEDKLEARIGNRDRGRARPLDAVQERSPYVLPEVWLVDDTE